MTAANNKHFAGQSVTGVRHLSENEFADREGVSVKTVQTWRLRGIGPPFLKLGLNGAVRYRQSDVEKWEASCLRHSTSDPGLSAPGVHLGLPLKY